MSPLDPTIPLSVRPFQGVNILAIQENQRRQAEESRLAEQDAFEREKFGLARQQLAEQRQAQQAIGEAYAGSVDTDEQGNRVLNRQKFMEHVMSTAPQAWPSIQEQLDKVDEADLRRRKTRAEVAKLEREDEQANDEATARFGFAVDLAGNTPEAWNLLKQDAIDNKRVNPEKIAAFDAAVQEDPSKIASITAAMKSRLMKPGEEAKLQDADRRQAEIERRNAANEQLAQQRAQAQEDRATASEQRMEAAAAESARHNRAMEGLSAQRAASGGAAGGEGGLTKDSIEDLATSYRVLGVRAFPTRISGKDREQAMNEASSQRRLLGQSQAQEIQKQAAFQADKSALTRMKTASSAAQAFEDKAVNQIDMIKGLSAKVPRTSFPLINSALQAGRTSITGDTNATQLANAIDTFTAEYAKIISGATGSSAAATDSARAASAKLLNAAMSKGTMNDVLNLMQKEMRLTIRGYDTVIGDISERMGGQPAAPSAAPATGVTGKVGKYTYTVK